MYSGVIRIEELEKGKKIGERELVALCANGDKSAMKELYNRYAARLCALCSRYSCGPEEGMDLMHDAMAKAFKMIDKYKYSGEGSLYAWLRSVAVNLAIDRLRKEKRLEISTFSESLPDVTAPEIIEITKIPNSVLRGLISRLPESKKMIFNMFCLEGLSHKEIASRLGITERGSTSALAKAKKELAVMIKDYWDKEK